MDYRPKPEVGKEFKEGNGTTFKVISEPTDDGVYVLKTMPNGSTSKILMTINKWNSKHFPEEGNSGSGGSKSTGFVLDIDAEGHFTITKDGKVVGTADIRGPKGEEGKQGEKGPRGDAGPQGHQGIPGVDGNTWTPVVTDDGNGLYFVNADGERHPKEGTFNIRGARGDKGDKGETGDRGERGPQGESGANGKNGDTWTPVVSEDGETLHFENQNGDKTPTYQIRGKQGEQGIQGQTGERGIQGPVGPKGNDGKQWKPEISTDGKQLRFVNELDATDFTPWYNIQGSKGDTGGEGPRGKDGPVGPYFIPSVNADGELTWSNTGTGIKNPAPRNIKGDRGPKGDDGVTYHPIVKDGVLYWYDDKGNLIKETTPVKITGVKGETGLQGGRGLSAYQIWLKQGNIGTEQDFLDSLKGEKGTPAPPANFSFLDVEDYTCPIQKIDTNLIVDKDEGTKSPEDIIEERKKDIEDLRKKGHEKDFQKANRVGRFKKAMWWCAGVDRDLLTMCPADHSKYVGVGTVILFTAFMAWFSSFIAINLVFPTVHIDIGWFGKNGIDLPLWAIIFATFWAAMIFFLDRFITNTMYSDGKVTISKQEFICGLPRIIIAIFLGIVISAPLELKIFEDKIEMEMDTQKRLERVAEEKKAESRANRKFQDLLDGLELKRKTFERQQTQSNNSLDKLNAKRPKDKIQKQSGSYLGRDGEYHDYEKSVNLNAKAQKNWDEDTTNIKAKATYTSSVQAATDSINAVNSRIHILEEQRDSMVSAEIKDILHQFDVNFDRGLSRQLSTLHSLGMEGYRPWNKSEKGKRDVLTFADSCTQAQVNNVGEVVYVKSNESFEEEQEDGFWDIILLHRLWHYLFFSAQGLIMLLFILIDISPVLYKMMLADGNYDNYLHQEKLLAQDKIRLSLSNMLKKLDESELKRVAPFIMGDIYEKMAGDSYVYKTEEEYKNEIASQKSTHGFWRRSFHIVSRLWPFSWIIWLIWKEEEKPSAPVIVLNKKDQTDNQKRVVEVNQQVFEEVLDCKRKLILASYRRWYKTQHDCIICDDIDDENKGKEPFAEDDIDGDDSDIHVGTDDPVKNDSDTGTESNTSDEDEDSDADETENDTTSKQSDTSEQAEDSEDQNEPEEDDSSDVDDDDEDEVESPDDDGDDMPNKDKR